MAIGVKPSIRISLYAGLSSLFASLLYQSIRSFVFLPALEQLRRAETIAIVSIGLLVIIEPLLSRIKVSPLENALSERHDGFLVRSLVVIVLVSFSDGLLHDYLGETISPRGWTGIVQIISSLIGPGVITFSWLRGLRKTPPRAKKYGLYTSMAVGVFFFALDVLFLMNYSLQKVHPSPEFGRIRIMEAEAVFGLFFLSPVITVYVASGFLGGLAVDRDWCRHAWQRIALGLGVAAIVQPASLFLALDLAYRASRTKMAIFSLWSFMLEPAIGNIGWSLGFVLVPDADTIFRSERTEPVESLSLRGESAKVACAALSVASILTVFSLVCMGISEHITADITADTLNRGSRPRTTLSPSASSGLNERKGQNK